MRFSNKIFFIFIQLLSLFLSGCSVSTISIPRVGPQPMDRSVFHMSVDPDSVKLAETKSSSELFYLWKENVMVSEEDSAGISEKLGKALGIKLQKQGNDPVYSQILTFVLDKPNNMVPSLLANIGTCSAVDIAVAMQEKGKEMIARDDMLGYEMKRLAYRAFSYIRGEADPKIVSGCLWKTLWL